MTTNSRIAVVGAGPGGLMCARILQLHGIDVAVYEADASVHSRDLGGTLDLHADTGQIAIEDAGLVPEFTALARVESQAKRRLDQYGTVLGDFVPDEDDAAAPEIDRGQLRAMLAEQVRPGTVRWEHKLVSATPLGGGGHRLLFAGGTVAEADLVIGADGAWSRVRPLLSDAMPRYTGISFVDVRFRSVETRYPHIADLVGPGHMFAAGGGRGIILQRNSEGQVRGLVAMRTELDWYDRADIDLADTAAVRRYLVEKEFSGWPDELLAVITDGDDVLLNRPIHALPAPLVWAHVPGVTLLGDAAHVMAPFGGFGVNLAMFDGMELAHAIATESTLDDAVTRYEEVMLPRSGEYAVGANDALDRFFSPGEVDPTQLRDHAAEHERYREAAAAYRTDRPGPNGSVPTGSGSPAEGGWTLRFRIPSGEREVDLVLTASENALHGTLDGVVIDDGAVHGNEISFRAQLTSPFKMKIKCAASIEGDTMTGKAKATMMSIPFTATRRGH